MDFELIVGFFGLFLILCVAGVAAAFSFVFMPMRKKKDIERQYPVAVPRWGIRLSGEPPFKNTVEDIAKAMDTFFDRVMQVKKYDRRKLKSVLDKLVIDWSTPRNSDNGRYIYDSYNRKIAGDNSGNRIRVVVLSTDTLGRTAFFHELGHSAQELEGKVDPNHTDDVMWDDIVGWCKKRF